MGVGRLILSKTLRVVVPFAGVVVPVVCLFSAFLALVAATPEVNVDLFGVIVGAMVFSASLIYMGLKQEKAVEQEDDWNVRRNGK